MSSGTASSTASAYALLKINISRVVPSTTSRQRSGSVRLPLFDEKRSGPPSRAESPDHEYHPVPHGQPYVHRPPWWPHWLLKYATWSNVFTLAKYLIPSLILWLVYLWWTYEFYFEMYVYKREWAYREVVQVEPLAGCFNPGRISPAYNISEAVYGPKRHNIQGGVPLRIDMDCYNLAGTIRNSALNPKPPVSSTKGRQLFHTYWRTDLVPFGERQEWMLKSFFATQDLQSSTLILWSNGDLSQSPYLVKWLKRYPHAFKTRLVDIQAWSKGTALEGSPLLGIEDEKAWVDGDLVRLLVAWAFGGVWIDMDSLFTRDLSPLLDHEFFTAWDCYERRYQALNGALMHFFKHSPYLCEAFHIMARSAPPRAGSTDWGSDLYFKLWRRLIAAGVPPFQVLPFCFSDGGLCRADNRIPDPFDPDPASWGMGRSLKEGGELDQVLNKVFVLHLHNRWEKKFPRGGWVERLLLTKFERRLAEMEMELDLDRKPSVISPPPPAAAVPVAVDENQAPIGHKPPPPRVILKRGVPETDEAKDEEDEEDDTPMKDADVVQIDNDHNATN